ncbi:3-hydroxyphenylacetate 6 hydroxylase, partial [Metarhizium brunneum ARSEF 3297]
MDSFRGLAHTLTTFHSDDAVPKTAHSCGKRMARQYATRRERTLALYGIEQAFRALQMQKTVEVYLQWAAQYGDVFRIHLGYTPALVINSVEAAKQILHRNSQVVASRPSFYRFHTIVSKNLGTTIGASKFNTSLKRTRKEIASEGSKPAVRTHLADIDLETRHLLRDLMNSCGDGQTPVDMYMPVSRLGLSLMMTICYGRRMFLEDPLTTEIINVEDQLLGLRSPSGNYLDYLPLLRLFPFTPLA